MLNSTAHDTFSKLSICQIVLRLAVLMFVKTLIDAIVLAKINSDVKVQLAILVNKYFHKDNLYE